MILAVLAVLVRLALLVVPAVPVATRGIVAVLVVGVVVGKRKTEKYITGILKSNSFFSNLLRKST